MTLPVRLSPEEEILLEQTAQQLCQKLIRELSSPYSLGEDLAWQLPLIEQSLFKVQSGNAKFASHEAVTEWLKSWGSQNERTAPICK